jgi:uncharacterized protein with PIN domain
MNYASFRFYAELNDFLSASRRAREFTHRFFVSPSVKDAIEGFGVPHTEVDLVLVNGESVDFTYLIQDGDRVSVYPVFESVDITPLLRVRPRPLRVTRFVLDIHLGRLTSYLRMMGFDSIYGNNCDDAELASISSRERRILLTRDRGLLKRSMVTHGYLVREMNPRLQLVEVLRRFDLFGAVAPFTRCLECNHPLRPVEKASVAHRVPENTVREHDEFWTCDECGRVYWEGSHHRRMSQFIDYVRNQRIIKPASPLSASL